MTRTDEYVNIVIQLADGRIALGRVPALPRQEAEQLYAELGQVLRAPVGVANLPSGLKVVS